MAEKKFALEAHEISTLISRGGGCIASDRITVDGQKVGFMCREEPSFSSDSGWRFFAGDESQEYADEPKNFEIYDVNTIANYDPDIIPHLRCTVGSELERHSDSDDLVDVNK